MGASAAKINEGEIGKSTYYSVPLLYVIHYCICYVIRRILRVVSSVDFVIPYFLQLIYVVM